MEDGLFREAESEEQKSLPNLLVELSLCVIVYISV